MSRLTEKELVLIRRKRAATQRTAVAAPGRRTGLLASVADATRQALRRRRTLAELSRLDDHMLRDIGLERGSLDDVADVLAARDAAGDKGLMARLRRWNLKRKTVGELRSLDDRTLDDIGIVRGDIPFAVEQAIVEAEAKQAVPSHIEGLVTDIRTAKSRKVPGPAAAGYAWHAAQAVERSLEIAARRQAS